MKFEIMKRIFLLIFVLISICNCFNLTACEDKDDTLEGDYIYDPYDNPYKDDVPNGKKIKITENEYIFSSIMVRDKSGVLDVAAQNALENIYEYVFVEFTAEDTVIFYDYTGFFNIKEKKGIREGNVLTIENTNDTGDYTYNIRIEIHKDKIIVIHNAHFYDTPGKYATITFALDE